MSTSRQGRIEEVKTHNHNTIVGHKGSINHHEDILGEDDVVLAYDVPLTKKLKDYIIYHTYLPSSESMNIWNALILAFVIYNAITVPLRMGFRVLWGQEVVFIAFSIFDYIGDTLFWADIFVRFKTAYFDYGILISDPKKKAIRYATSWFPVELLATLPYDIFYWRIYWVHSALRLPRLLRLSRAKKYFDTWEQYSRYPILVQLAELLAGLIVLIHWLACIYFTIAYVEGFGTTEWTPKAETLEEDFPIQYLHAVFWSTRALTGFGGEVHGPESDFETFFMLGVALMALFMVAVVIGSLADTISNMNASRQEFREKMAKMNRYLSNKQIPSVISTRVRQYYEHLWSRQRGVEDAALEDLPKHLRADISMFLHSDIIQKVPFFKDGSDGFIKALVNFLIPQIYFPGDSIIEAGDVGEQMFFIRRGEVDIFSHEGVFLTHLSEGGFFGEIALLIKSQRTATVKACAYCDVFVLEKSNLDKVLKIYPEEKVKIMRIAESRVGLDALRKLIPNEPIFYKMNDKILNECVDCFQPETLEIGEFLFKQGTKANSIYFLGMGTLEVIRGGVVVNSITEGNFIGVVDFILGRKRAASLKASAKCTMFVMTVEDWDSILSHNPESASLIFDLGRENEDTWDYLPENLWETVSIQGSGEHREPGDPSITIEGGGDRGEGSPMEDVSFDEAGQVKKPRKTRFMLEKQMSQKDMNRRSTLKKQLTQILKDVDSTKNSGSWVKQLIELTSKDVSYEKISDGELVDACTALSKVQADISLHLSSRKRIELLSTRGGRSRDDDSEDQDKWGWPKVPKTNKRNRRGEM